MAPARYVVPGRVIPCVARGARVERGASGLATRDTPGQRSVAPPADLEGIQKRALAEGLPYQTLIASLLHKYAAGRLKEV